MQAFRGRQKAPAVTVAAAGDYRPSGRERSARNFRNDVRSASAINQQEDERAYVSERGEGEGGRTEAWVGGVEGLGEARA